MARIRAGLFHLLLSFFIASAVFALMWFVWYPKPLFKALGGGEIFLLLLMIDVIVGPLLTTIVFNPQKKSLKFDLIIIAVVQIAALAYGVHTLFKARPVYIAALGPRFEVIHASDVSPEELRASGQTLPLWGPKWVGTEKSPDAALNQKILLSAMAGLDRGHYPQTHVQLSRMNAQLVKEAESISELKRVNLKHESEIDQWLAARRVRDSEVVWQPLMARSINMVVMLRASNAEVLGIAPFRPMN